MINKKNETGLDAPLSFFSAQEKRSIAAPSFKTAMRR